MDKLTFTQLINVKLLNKMFKSLYEATGIPGGIFDAENNMIISVGWQDICVKFHRENPETCKRCIISDQFKEIDPNSSKYIQYKCLNNMWDIQVPIIIHGKHLGTIIFGQFFYEDEIVDLGYFREQALKYGFDEKEYLDALSKVRRVSKESIQHLIEYYLALVMTLAESGLRKLESEESKKQLAKDHKYLDTVLNSVSDAIFIIKTDGKIVGINEATVTMFGYSPEEIKGMNIKKIALRELNNTEFSHQEVLKIARTKNPLLLEFIVKNKDGEEFWVEVNTHLTNIDSDEIIVATVRNITDRKQAELVLKNEAIEMEKLRTEFFANISHELRTPISIILSSIQIVKMHLKKEDENIDKSKIYNNLKIQKQNCYRLVRLVNNLIDTTKLDSGNFEINIGNYNIVDIVEQITLSAAEYTNENNLNVIFDTDVEEKIIACDPDLIERIIYNLLSNSIKFTEPGGNIFVNISDGEDYITIYIKDTGIGIPNEKINVIFDKLTQVDKSFTRNNEGSGLGLALVKSLVEKQGGTISVESKYGLGTTFTVKFPVKVLEPCDYNNSNKFINKTINNYVNSMEIEFSDIYK